MAQIQEFLGTGRRKTAVARVRLASGSGKILVNGRPRGRRPQPRLKRRIVRARRRPIEPDRMPARRPASAGGGLYDSIFAVTYIFCDTCEVAGMSFDWLAWSNP